MQGKESHCKALQCYGSKMSYEIGAKADCWLPLDLGCDGQTVKQINPSGKSLYLDHISSTEGIRKTYKSVVVLNYSFLIAALVNERAKSPLKALTPEAQAISIYVKIQNSYL